MRQLLLRALGILPNGRRRLPTADSAGRAAPQPWSSLAASSAPPAAGGAPSRRGASRAPPRPVVAGPRDGQEPPGSSRISRSRRRRTERVRKRSAMRCSMCAWRSPPKRIRMPPTAVNEWPRREIGGAAAARRRATRASASACASASASGCASGCARRRRRRPSRRRRGPRRSPARSPRRRAPTSHRSAPAPARRRPSGRCCRSGAASRTTCSRCTRPRRPSRRSSGRRPLAGARLPRPRRRGPERARGAARTRGGAPASPWPGTHFGINAARAAQRARALRRLARVVVVVGVARLDPPPTLRTSRRR